MTASLAPLPAALAALVARATAIDLRPYEARPTDDALVELEARVHGVLVEAQALLHDVLVRSEAAPRAVRVTATDVPMDPATPAGARESIEELAVMAIIELRQCAQHIAAGHRAEPVARVIWCDTAIRRTQRGLAAVENAIAVAAAQAPRLDGAATLEASLRIRRCYARFGTAVAAAGAPDAARLRTAMRRLGTLLAVLIGRDEFRDLRIRDRATIRGLQRRVLDWLRAGDLANPLTGVRIWQDLIGTVEIFRQVNRRQELVAHDQAVLTAAWAAVHGATAGPVAPAVRTALASLEGLDPELDRVLGATAPSRDDLIPVLDRLRPQPGDPRARGDVPTRVTPPNPRGDSSHGPR